MVFVSRKPGETALLALDAPKDAPIIEETKPFKQVAQLSRGGDVVWEIEVTI